MSDFCIICNKIFNPTSHEDIPHCCSGCLEKLYLNRLDNSSFNLSKSSNSCNTYSIFYYQNMSRELLLRAKAKNDPQALNLIESLVSKEIPNILSFLNLSCSDESHLPSLIVPTPSSLWSRLKGKYDVAFVVALVLSKSLKIPLKQAGFKFGWNLLKRSKDPLKNFNSFENSSSSDIQLHKDVSTPQSFPNTVLIVDDVLTTGQTLIRISHEFTKRGFQVIFLTFATSRSFFKNQF